MATERFTLFKSDGQSKRPWIIEDTASPKLEDPRLYHFSSKRKAEEFKAMLMAEAASDPTVSSYGA